MGHIAQAKAPKTRSRRKRRREGELTEAACAIVVVGVGGAGCNAVQHMLECRPVPGVRYVCVNTDLKSLARMRGAEVIRIGEKLTHGLGAGGVPDVGSRAAENGKDALATAIGKSDLVFLAAGMGGGTGTGAAPVVAEIARQSGALVVAVVTTPFSFEGIRRLETAHSGIARLRDKVDNLIVIHNDRLLSMFHKDAPMEEALKRADEALTLGVLSVAEVVNEPGEINVDFADLRSIIKLPGYALMDTGEASGKGAAAKAAQQAVNNPLFDLSIEGAKGLLFNIHGGPNLTLGEVNAVGSFIASRLDPDAMIFFGMLLGAEWEDRVHITLIATGIPVEKAQKRFGFPGPMHTETVAKGMARGPLPTNGHVPVRPL
ncbi:MAG: cell division protein FtsZ [Chloroflexota bacterium]|nr:cell division protein FtsZ [Chloroflexota bacterium]